MLTIFYYVKFIFKMVIGIVLLPFWILYVISKYMIFRYTFSKNLKDHGIDKATSKSLLKELNIFPYPKYIKHIYSSTK